MKIYKIPYFTFNIITGSLIALITIGNVKCKWLDKYFPLP